jgi:hypothetical protein
MQLHRPAFYLVPRNGLLLQLYGDIKKAVAAPHENAHKITLFMGSNGFFKIVKRGNPAAVDLFNDITKENPRLTADPIDSPNG